MAVKSAPIVISIAGAPKVAASAVSSAAPIGPGALLIVQKAAVTRPSRWSGVTCWRSGNRVDALEDFQKGEAGHQRHHHRDGGREADTRQHDSFNNRRTEIADAEPPATAHGRGEQAAGNRPRRGDAEDEADRAVILPQVVLEMIDEEIERAEREERESGDHVGKRPQDRLPPEEAHPGEQFGRTALVGRVGPPRRRGAQPETGEREGGDREGERIDTERGGGAKPGGEHAGEHRADDARARETRLQATVRVRHLVAHRRDWRRR